MTEKPAEIIQTLREADEQSKTTIEAARRERDTRLKQAAIEAEAEITEYRTSRERDYQAQMNSFVGSTGETSEKIASDAKQSIAKTVTAAEGNKLAVVDMLVAYVKDVRVNM